MAGNIWVFAEQWRGQISQVTYELLAQGREIADVLGVPLEAVLLGSQTRELATTLGAADSVLSVDHPALAEPIPELYASTLAQLIRAQSPHILMMPMTNVALDVASTLAAQADAPFVNFCKDTRVVDGALQVQCLLYGGKLEATVVATRAPIILAIMPGSRPADKGRKEGMPQIIDLTVTLDAPLKVCFKKYIEPEAGDIDITRQDILVAVGRGIQSQENLPLAEELADALGGAVCSSRPVIDQGWLPLSRQVGKSGATVKPKLYLAAGISGAPEHVEGMKDSTLIIAINTDPQAPIFNLAHYGVVGDVLEVLPALTTLVHDKKGLKAHA